MYYQLNKFTGRLASSVHLQSPLFPVVPIALQRADPPVIKYTTTQFSSVSAKDITGGARKPVPGGVPGAYYAAVPEHIKQKQELFQREDGVPVYLKGGTTDKILYRITLALIAVGLVGVGDLLFTMAFGKKA